MEAQREKPDATSKSRQLFEDAVVDAQFMVAYAAGKCKRDIDKKTLTTLVTAKRLVDEKKAVEAEFEAEFWLAYQRIWTLVKPATAESIKANLLVDPGPVRRLFKNIPVLSPWLSRGGACKARQTVNRYIGATVLVLLVVLLFQIYWVIGNQLTSQLAGLLQRETELSQAISANRLEYNTLEVQFKQSELNSESFKTTGVYTFYSGLEWERATQKNISVRGELEKDLASLKSQIERNSNLLFLWSTPSNRLMELMQIKEDQPTSADLKDQYYFQMARINRQIEEIDIQLQADPRSPEQIKESIPALEKDLADLVKDQEAHSAAVTKLTAEIEALKSMGAQAEADPALAPEQIQESIPALENELALLVADQEAIADEKLKKQSEIDALTNRLNLVAQLKQDKERLEEEKASVLRQQLSAIKREESHKDQLAGQFVLVILQSYMLPLLYGILGAGTSILRSLSNEIEKVTFSEAAGIQHLLRISLGALAGIMVGWFSFLIPDESTTFVGSISPLAIAFIVGYNIELFFSVMDRGLNWVIDKVRQPAPTPEEEPEQTTDSEKDKPAETPKRTVVNRHAHPVGS